MTIEKNLNYTGFFENQKAYVKLSLDLNSIRHQDKYRVVFYAETKRFPQDPYMTDFTQWVTFPPLSVDISTLPTLLTLRPGEQKTIVLKVNSTIGYEPVVSLNVIVQPGIRAYLEFNKLRIHSYGMVTIPLTVASDAIIRP